MKNLLLFTFCLLISGAVFGQTTIAIQDFELTPTTPTLGITSNANATTSNGSTSYPSGDGSHASEGSYGMINSSNSQAIIEFDAVDISSYSNVTLSFKLAALSGTSGNGMDAADYARVSISTDNGATYSDELQINGNSNARWGYTTGTGVASTTYDGDNSATPFSPSSGGALTTQGYSTVSISGITATSQLKVKIFLKDNSGSEQWAIDEVKITGLTGSAVGFVSGISDVSEGNSGTTIHQVGVSMTSAPSSDVTVQVTDLGSGSATAGVSDDYTFTTTDLTFTTGESYPATKYADITINGDTDVETPETINLNLAVTVGSATVTTSSHTTTISNEDCAPDAIDNFTDGDFTNSPAWEGDVSDYEIVTDAILAGGSTATDETFLGSKSSVGKSALVTSSANVTEWKFSLGSGNFSPSGSNYFGVILMSDIALSGDISTASWNGYYLKIGAGGSSDKIELYKRTATTSTSIGTFNTSTYGGGLDAGANIRVTRDGSGNFELFYADNVFDYLTDPTTSANTLTDNTHQTSCYFGIYTVFANPNSSRKVFIDNVNDQTDALPVELLHFTAKAQNQTTILTWATATEENNAYFEVQRSTNGVNFEKIGQVDGAGTVYEVQEYMFVDEKPLNGINYYRLRQVDFDGQTELHKIISVAFEANLDIKVYPTIVENELFIVSKTQSLTNATIRIYNVNGQVIYNQSNLNTNSIDVSKLEQGIYFIRLVVGNQRISTSFIKQ